MPDDWFDGAGGNKSVDVAALLDGPATPALVEIVACGALVSLGTTSDGGALAVTITVDGRWRREYFRDAEELVDWLSEALPAVRHAVESISASAGRGKRERRSRGL